VVQHYAADLSDLPVRVRAVLQQQPAELLRMAGEALLDTPCCCRMVKA